MVDVVARQLSIMKLLVLYSQSHSLAIKRIFIPDQFPSTTKILLNSCSCVVQIVMLVPESVIIVWLSLARLSGQNLVFVLPGIFIRNQKSKKTGKEERKQQIKDKWAVSAGTTGCRLGIKCPVYKTRTRNCGLFDCFFAAQFYQFVKLCFPLDPELKRQLQFDRCFLHPEKYDPVKFLGSAEFAKVLQFY